MKKMLMVGFVMAAVVVFGDEPKPQGGPYKETVEGVEWTFMVDADLNASVGTGSSSGKAVPQSTTGAIAIPSTLGGRTVTNIGAYAFYWCRDLTSVTIPNVVTGIENHAFYGCSSVTNVTIPSSVMSIGYGAFSTCTRLTSVRIPEGVTSIEKETFYSCTSLTSVTIPDGVTSIGDFAFCCCSSLTSVPISPTVTSIGCGAFRECAGLKSVTIPESVTSIGSSAFQECTSLTSVTIPSSVINVGGSAFYGCDKIGSVTLPGWCCEISFTSVTNLVISEGTVILRDAAFSYCYSLTSVTIPSSVTCIGNRAFSGCTSLTSVTIPEGVMSMGRASFANCSSLTSVTIPSSVTNIAESAFYGCRGLTSVTIPSSVTSIGVDAFGSCGSLMAIIVSPENVFYSSADGVLFNKDKTVLFQYPGGKGASYTVPSSVMNIGEDAFAYCRYLTSVTIPSSVTGIGDHAFEVCQGLREINFDGDAPVTGYNAFLDTPYDMVMRVKDGSSGWFQWNGRRLEYQGGGGGSTNVTVTMISTNVVIHYIQTSELSPMAAPITPDVGIVNVMTEIEGGIVAVPESWATNYPSFKQKFGDDFAVALTRETGKFDANRKPMYVWQDYVAGTDPTNVEDQFRASVTMVEGKSVISYTPVLSETEAAKRVYTIYGKVKLQDEEWTPIPEGQEADYNFFKVTVKMK